MILLMNIQSIFKFRKLYFNTIKKFLVSNIKLSIEEYKIGSIYLSKKIN